MRWNRRSERNWGRLGMKYKTYSVAELIDEIAMGPFGSNIKVSCFVDEGIPVLNGSNLDDFVLKEDSFRYITEEKANSLKKANAYRGDIVITHRGTLGQVSYIPENSKYDRYVISQSQFRVKCNNKVLPEYLVYYLHTPIGQHKLLSNASQVGVPALARPTTTFQQLEIELPDIQTQKKIVSVLNSLQKKIALTQQINDNLEQQIDLIYQSFFAEDMERVELGKAIKTTSGGTPSRKNLVFYENANIPWVKSKELSGNFITDTEEKINQLALNKSSAKLLPSHSVLVAMYGATVGEYGIITTEMACNQAICVLLENCDYPFTYLFEFVKHFQEVLKSRAIGSAQQNISQLVIKQLMVHSNTDKIKKYHKIVLPLFQKMELLCKENARLTDIRDCLLPKLMSGEISFGGNES
ncbi:MAG: restriction endonuclease subunit S [Clostridium sp.]|nr:MAG: restriction endonuclease subunit S [Clostridium sp.]